MPPTTIDLIQGMRIIALGRPAIVVTVGPQQSEVRFTGERDSRIICNNWATVAPAKTTAMPLPEDPEC